MKTRLLSLFIVLVTVQLTRAATVQEGVDTSRVARTQFEYSIGPAFFKNAGYTEYILQASGRDEFPKTIDTVLMDVKSQLEFPLDVIMVGVDFRMTVNKGSRGEWSVQAGLFTSVSEPGGDMKDHDWIGVPSRSIVERKFSYTESEAEMKALLFTLEFAKPVFSRPAVDLSFLAAFTYHRIGQDVNGYSGWRLPDWHLPDGGERKTLYGTGKALDYTVTYLLPQYGILARVKPDRKISLDLITAVTRAFASDRDDHVIRNKLSEASTTGWGFLARFRGRLILPSPGEIAPFVDVNAEYLTISTSGHQNQRWYDDEMSWNSDTQQWEVEVPKGTTIKGIHYEINSMQYRLGFNLGLSF